MTSRFMFLLCSHVGKDDLRLSVLMGLRKRLSLCRRMRRALTEDEQHKIASAIVEHLGRTNCVQSKGRCPNGMGTQTHERQ